MRIQHNIMAMNAYRNYNTNTSALSRNLEKLSSGYKINRAGDDAAGLAISEKMRAQITGLNAAQKNVKDGISLVKTAEGAMQEIQDMLNRMDYLATQSANGTYQDEVDRENLQKEVNQLLSEINRIADSSNFNGIKLLDGSLMDGSTAKTDALKAAADAQAAADAALADAENATGPLVFGKETKASTSATQATNNKLTPNAGAIEDKYVLETDYKDTDKPGFAVSFDGVTHTFKDPAGTTATDNNDASVTLNIKGTANVPKTLTEAEIAAAYKSVTGKDAKAGDTASGEVLAKAFADKFGTADDALTVDTNYKYSVKADGNKLVFTTTDTQTQATRHYNVQLHGLKNETIAAKGAEFKTGALTQTGTAGAKEATVTVAYTDADGNEKTKDVKFNSAAAAAGSATALIAALNGDADLSKLFTAAGDDAGVTLTSKTAGADGKAAVTGITVKTPGDDTVAIAAGEAAKGYDAYDVGTNGYLNQGTEVTVQSGTPAIDQLASTVITLDATAVADGKAIRLGDQTYVFAVGADSKYKDAENAVYVDGLKSNDGDFLDKMCTKLAEVAKNNKTFTVSHMGTNGQIGVKQLQEVKDSTDMSTKDKLESFIGLTSVDETKTAESNAAAVEAAKADAAKLQEKADELKKAAETAVDGKTLQLQIGDTSDTFNQLQVSVGDMHAKALGLEGLDISNAKAASDSIQTIKDAINRVSSVRGDLGATQNRLEHTANNLSVMAENIQDAESTIRDTDVAEEMMAYTKNNILIQSAQAMLAQANAVPQGVLQLLG